MDTIQAVTYGVEVDIDFIQELIPENLWKEPTKWVEGVPCYKSLDGTKSIIRLCNPNRIGVPNLGYNCSWYNYPSEHQDLLNSYFVGELMTEVELQEKLKSADYCTPIDLM